MRWNYVRYALDILAGQNRLDSEDYSSRPRQMMLDAGLQLKWQKERVPARQRS
jgi:hypothetical protein